MYQFDVQTHEITLVREKATAVWSPDGEWLAGFDHSKAKTPFLMRPDGSDFQVLNIPSSWMKWGVQEYRWFPDSSALYIISRPQTSPEEYYLLFYDLQTDEAELVHEFYDKRFFSGDRMYPSPDGKWILIRTRNQRGGSLAILTSWEICSQDGCTSFAPPDIDRCNDIEWAGPYPQGVVINPYTK